MITNVGSSIPMKRILLSVVLLLGFLFTSSFSNGPEEQIVYKSGRDSTTLEVKFQNPRVIISDERTSEAITTYFRERDSLSVAVLRFLDEAQDVMQQDQERRYESAMDYLSRRYDLSPTIIESNIKQTIHLHNMLKLSYAIMTFIVLISWWAVTRNLLIDWQERFIQLGLLIAFLVALYILFCAILRISVPFEYQFLNEIIKLSSG